MGNTLDWTRNIKDGEYVVTKTSNDRKVYKPDQDYAKTNVQNFRRFPKNHDSHENRVIRKSKSNLLSQEGLLGQEPVQKV